MGSLLPRSGHDLSSKLVGCGCPVFRLVAAIRRHHTIIVLSVLKIPLGGSAIARRRRFLGERKVSFHDLPCIAVDPLSLATVSVGLEPRLPASAAIPAPLRSLRIGSLSHDI